MTASIVRPAFSRRRRLRLSVALAALVAALTPAVWASGAGAAVAPEGRAYEMVSPPDKNFGDVSIGADFFGGAAAAHNGEAAAFCTTGNFGGTSAGTICGDYVSHRDAGDQRWETTPVSPPYCTIDNTDPAYVWLLKIHFQLDISADMRKVVTLLPEGGGGCPFEPLDPFAPTPSLNLYMFDEVGNPESARLLAPEPGAPGSSSPLQTYAGGLFDYVAGSPDLSHIVFESTGQQTPEVPADGQSRLWEWTNGTVRLLAKDPANVPFAAASDLASAPLLASNSPYFGLFERFNTVSVDGSRIFFVTPTPSDPPSPSDQTDIYMRENGATTHHVSESECTSSCGPTAADRFLYATPDGDKVLIRSVERLTDDPTPSGTNLYMYTHSADPASDQNLTLLSRDDEPADGTETTIQFQPGVIGTSDDGEDVYFVTEGQLVPGESTASGMKLYRWQANGGNPELSFLAILDGGDGLNWSDFYANPDRYVTPDGEHLLVQTNVALDPAADHNDPAAASGRDVYRWSEDDGWTCISCTGAGGSSGGGFVAELADQGGARQTGRERRPISDDGSRVFFQSEFALVPRDTNRVRDVYMWEDGTVSLVSSGKSPYRSMWVGASADGDDVFFVSRERLVGWDTDNNSDLYDARVGGGFPEPPASPAPCTGEECQNPPAGPPAAPGSGSSDFKGSGNVGGSVRSSISGIRGLSAAARSALAKGGRVRLRLRVNRAGRVRVVGTAKAGRKRSRVLSSSVRAKRAGLVSVPFALSTSARGELRRKGSLTITLIIRFKDARPRAIVFTVRSATAKKGRRS